MTAEQVEAPPLQPKVVTGDPRSLTLLEKNARYMRHEQYQALVANIRRDGALTSAPLVHLERLPDGGERRTVLSGNHRTQAAIEAGLSEIVWLEVDQSLTREQAVAIQLSHNAIAGEDDPALLKSLYEELQGLDWREYAGLDDKTLDLLAQVDAGSIAEANLTFQTLSIVYLPEDLDAARATVQEALELTKGANERWVATYRQFARLMEAVDLTSKAYDVKNVATALGIIFDVFDRHKVDLQDGWLDQDGEAKHGGFVPLESVFGTDAIPADAAAVVARALKKMVAREEVPGHHLGLAIERWAADYLSGP